MGIHDKVLGKYQIRTQLDSRFNDIGDMETLMSPILGAPSINLIDFVAYVHRTLDQANLPFVIGGGLAVAAQGTPRQTMDLDILVLAKEHRHLQEVLLKAGFTKKGVYDLHAGRVEIHKYDYQGRELDVLNFPKHPAFLTFLVESAEKHQLMGKQFRFLSTEGLILTKLISFRRKDQMDIDGMKDKNLDVGVLKTWCANLGIMDRYVFMEQPKED